MELDSKTMFTMKKRARGIGRVCDSWCSYSRAIDTVVANGSTHGSVEQTTELRETHKYAHWLEKTLAIDESNHIFYFIENNFFHTIHTSPLYLPLMPLLPVHSSSLLQPSLFLQTN